jgi:hypothetical protein
MMCEHVWFPHKTENRYQCGECGENATYEAIILSKLNTIIKLLKGDNNG